MIRGAHLVFSDIARLRCIAQVLLNYAGAKYIHSVSTPSKTIKQVLLTAKRPQSQNIRMYLRTSCEDGLLAFPGLSGSSPLLQSMHQGRLVA